MAFARRMRDLPEEREADDAAAFVGAMAIVLNRPRRRLPDSRAAATEKHGDTS